MYESNGDSLRGAVCLINRFALKYRIGNNDEKWDNDDCDNEMDSTLMTIS